MTKYMEPLLMIVIVLIAGMVLMRIRYLLSIYKKESTYTFRNQEGDLSIVIFFLLVMNRSRFQRYALSYQPLLRYLYPIIVGLFIAYCLLQLTQIVMLTKTALVSPQGIVETQDIKSCSIKKYMYGHKMTVNYIKKEKETHLTLMIGKKNKEKVEEFLEKSNINIV